MVLVERTNWLPNSLWRKRIASAIAATLLVLALAACGQSPAAQPAEIGPTSLPDVSDSRPRATAFPTDAAPTLEPTSIATAAPEPPTITAPEPTTDLATTVAPTPVPAPTPTPVSDPPSTTSSAAPTPTPAPPAVAPTVSPTDVAPTPSPAPVPTATAVPQPQPPPGPARVTVPPTPAPKTNIQFSRTTPFVPLDQPVFLSASDGDYLPDADLVLGLDLMGQARAYPVPMLSYHHIVNDTVAGQPVLITY